MKLEKKPLPCPPLAKIFRADHNLKKSSLQHHNRFTVTEKECLGSGKKTLTLNKKYLKIFNFNFKNLPKLRANLDGTCSLWVPKITPVI